MLKYLQNEIQVMKTIKGQNIVNFIDVFWTLNNVYIITEYCEGGDLRSYQLKQKGPIEEEKARDILKQILEGFDILVSKQIIHRDLKPENILIKQNTFKIADFGFARSVDNFKSTLLSSMVGTPLYMSPQILKSQPYTVKSDIWSIGLIYYEMLYGKLPYTARSQYELIQKIQNQPLQFHFSIAVSEESKNLIKGCLQSEECNRYSWKQLLENPVVQEDKSFNRQITRVTKFANSLDNKSKLLIQKLQLIIQKKKIDLKQLFDLLDEDKTGELDIQEFSRLIKHIDDNKSTTDQECQYIFDKFDMNGDKSISYEEFKFFILETDYCTYEANKDPFLEEKAKYVLKKMRQKIQEEKINIEDLINGFDKNRQGGLTIGQFKEMVELIDPKITTKEAEYMFQKVDVDNSGLIDQQEIEEAIFEGSCKQNHKNDETIKSMDNKFHRIIGELKHVIQVNELNVKKIFKNFDVHKRNALGIGEFSKIIKIIDETIDQSEIEYIFNKIDESGDQLISFQEFNEFIQ